MLSWYVCVCVCVGGGGYSDRPLSACPSPPLIPTCDPPLPPPPLVDPWRLIGYRFLRLCILRLHDCVAMVRGRLGCDTQWAWLGETRNALIKVPPPPRGWTVAQDHPPPPSKPNNFKGSWKRYKDLPWWRSWNPHNWRQGVVRLYNY